MAIYLLERDKVEVLKTTLRADVRRTSFNFNVICQESCARL